MLAQIIASEIEKKIIACSHLQLYNYCAYIFCKLILIDGTWDVTQQDYLIVNHRVILFIY